GRVEFRVIPNIVDQNAAAERTEQPHEILADMTASDDSHNPARQLAPEMLPPVARENVSVRSRYVAQHADRERDDQFRDGTSVDAAGPAQAFSVGAHGRQINHVETDAELTDDPKVRQS